MGCEDSQEHSSDSKHSIMILGLRCVYSSHANLSTVHIHFDPCPRAIPTSNCRLQQWYIPPVVMINTSGTPFLSRTHISSLAVSSAKWVMCIVARLIPTTHPSRLSTHLEAQARRHRRKRRRSGKCRQMTVGRGGSERRCSVPSDKIQPTVWPSGTAGRGGLVCM
jgi:hypothetical protein